LVSCIATDATTFTASPDAFAFRREYRKSTRPSGGWLAHERPRNFAEADVHARIGRAPMTPNPFAEMAEGIDALADQRTGKRTLRNRLLDHLVRPQRRLHDSSASSSSRGLQKPND
jgi:hypothetical protein